MKNTLSALLCLGLAISANAADFGIGFAVNGDKQNKFLVPMKFNNGLRADAFLGYGKSKIDEPTRDTEANLWELGGGLYGTLPLAEGTTFYYGGQLAIRRGKGTVTEKPSGAVTTDNKLTGASISPLVGCDYFLAKKVSVGGEAGLRFSSQEIEPIGGAKTKVNSVESFTGVTMKIYF